MPTRHQTSSTTHMKSTARCTTRPKAEHDRQPQSRPVALGIKSNLSYSVMIFVIKNLVRVPQAHPLWHAAGCALHAGQCRPRMSSGWIPVDRCRTVGRHFRHPKAAQLTVSALGSDCSLQRCRRRCYDRRHCRCQ